MEYYETGRMTREQADAMIKWFYEEIGTDHEVNDEDDGMVYVMFCDLTRKEVEKVRAYENTKVAA